MPFTTIISATDLMECIRDPRTVVFDTRSSLSHADYGARVYAEGHIPGAFYLNLERDLSGAIGPTAGRHPLPKIDDFAEAMKAHGVCSESQVIAYDDAAGMFAARCWWLLKWLGHERVAILDGGLPAWIRAGGAEDVSVPQTPARGDFVARPQPELLIDVDQLQQRLAERSIVLCDARAPERYRGDIEPIDKVAGHVPGAINVPFAHNLDADGCFKRPEELARLHCHAPGAEAGSGSQIVHMCGSGVTACHNVLATVISGQPMPALYAGSWSEWITDGKRSIAIGD